MTVVDTKTNDIAWTMPMEPAPSPMAVSKKPDGSTDKIYAQNGRDNNFQVIDWATRKITQAVTLPDISGQEKNPFGPPAPSHGLMVTPDQKTLVIISRVNSALYTYSLPDVKLLGGVPLSGKGAGWLVLTPDGKRAYVANEHTNTVSADRSRHAEGTRRHTGRVRAVTERLLDAAVDTENSVHTKGR